MKPCFYICMPVLFLSFLSADSQKISKADKVILSNLQTEIPTLAADSADGRAMGSPGEKATGDFVISALSQSGVRPKGDDNGWLQTFTIDDGRQIDAGAAFTVNDQPLTLHRDWFPLSFSPAGEVSGSPAIALQESGVPWFLDIKDLSEEETGSQPELANVIRARAASCAKKGATALIVYNSSGHRPDRLTFDPKDRPKPAVIPVIYLTHEAKRKYFPDESASSDLRIRVGYTEKMRTGHNVIGFMDKGAPTTVVIASRYDNSSGLAGMIELARMLEVSKLKANNYLFIVLSGWGPEWPGAKFYCSHPAVATSKLNYTLELNRLAIGQEALHGVFIGGASTSATWPDVENAPRVRKNLSFSNDSAASSPGIQTFFVRQRIPSLVVSTGDGSDAVPPIGELRAVKFIFSLIEAADAKGKLVFTP